MKKLILLQTTILSIVFFSCSKINKDDTFTHKKYCDTSEVIINQASIEGYTHKTSYQPGEKIEFKIHTFSPVFNIEIFRNGSPNTTLHQQNGIEGMRQNYHCYSYSYGCNWKTVYEVTVDASWKSGLYSAKLVNPDDGKVGWITFVIKKDALAPKADIAVLASTNTWNAYNNWGGGSFYDFEMDENVISSENISFQRPNKYADPTARGGHLAAAETYLMRWMDENGYTWDQYSEHDLMQDENLLTGYKTIVLNSHPEYYTKEMYDRLYRYVQNGGHVAYLGGNAIWSKVVWDSKRDILEIRRNKQRHTFTSEIGGLWRDLGMPESSLMGVQYDERGYLTWHPYRVLDKNFWVFANTGLNNNDTFGEGCPDTGGASGHETDKVTPDSQKIPTLKIIAKGTNPNFGGADMIYYETSTGGKVFSVGSISYTSCLCCDSMVSKITRNVLNEFSK